VTSKRDLAAVAVMAVAVAAVYKRRTVIAERELRGVTIAVASRRGDLAHTVGRRSVAVVGDGLATDVPVRREGSVEMA